MEKYLEEGDLTNEEILRGLHLASVAGRISLVVPLAAAKMLGVIQLMDAIIEYLPSPSDVPAVKGTVPGSETEVEREPSQGAPLSALVFKTMADPYVGKLTLFRVYSGRFASNSTALNSTRNKVERVGQLYTIKGKTQEPAAAVNAGDIGAVAKLQDTLTGDTLCSQEDPVVFSPIKFPAPIYSVAVHPRTKGDEDKISTGLTRLTEEDPTITVERNAETAETILSGSGEVHVDVTTGEAQEEVRSRRRPYHPDYPFPRDHQGFGQPKAGIRSRPAGEGSSATYGLSLRPRPIPTLSLSTRFSVGQCPGNTFRQLRRGFVRQSQKESWPGILSPDSGPFCMTARITRLTHPKWRSRLPLPLRLRRMQRPTRSCWSL